MINNSAANLYWVSRQDEIIPAESGMANVFANILSKRPRSVKVPILAKVVKRKTPADRKPKKTVDFDVVKPCSSSSDSEGEEDINEKSYEGNALPKKLKKKKLRQVRI